MGGSAVSDRWQFHVPFSVRMILLEQSASKSRSLSFVFTFSSLSFSLSLCLSLLFRLLFPTLMSYCPPLWDSRCCMKLLVMANDDSFVIAWELSKVPSLLIKSGTLQKFIRGLFRLCGLFFKVENRIYKMEAENFWHWCVHLLYEAWAPFQITFLDVRVHCRRFCMSSLFLICLMEHRDIACLKLKSQEGAEAECPHFNQW